MDIELTADATLRPLVLPARADAADAEEFRELARVRNTVYRELTGRDEQDLSPDALLPLLRTLLLGMLVKSAALLAWRRIAPDSSHVITDNAEENRPMLSIDEALGFTAVAHEGAWKKDLTS